MANCCVICYKVKPRLEGSNDLGDGQKKEHEVLQRFFPLLERYLHEMVQNNGKRSAEDMRKQRSFPLDEVISIGMIACPDCRQVISSFCELYDEMKRIELLLQWKLWTVRNLMTSAQRVMPRVKGFRESVRKLEMEGTCSISSDNVVDLVLKSKKTLIDKCSRKLISGFPRLSITRLKDQIGSPNPQVQEDDNAIMTIRSNHDIENGRKYMEAILVPNANCTSSSSGNYNTLQLPNYLANLHERELHSATDHDHDAVFNDIQSGSSNQEDLTREGVLEIVQPQSKSDCTFLEEVEPNNRNDSERPREELVGEKENPTSNKLNSFPSKCSEDVVKAEIVPVEEDVAKTSLICGVNQADSLFGDCDYGEEEVHSQHRPDSPTSIMIPDDDDDKADDNINKREPSPVQFYSNDEFDKSDKSKPATPPVGNVGNDPEYGDRQSNRTEEVDGPFGNRAATSDKAVDTENTAICYEPTSTTRLLRTVHRCTNCRRTFSSKERLTNHGNECSDTVDTGDKKDYVENTEEGVEEMDIESDEDDLDMDTTDTSDEDDESSYAEGGEESESEGAEMELGPGELLKIKKITKAQGSTTGMIDNKNSNRRNGSMDKPWSCPDCSVSYSSQDLLNKHLLLKHPVTWKTLKYNRKHYPLPKYLGSSKKSSSKSINTKVAYRFKCGSCKLMFPQMHSLLLHRQRHHPPISISDIIEGCKGRTTRVKMLCFTRAPTSNRFVKTKYVQPFATLEVPDQGIFLCSKKSCRLPFYSKEDLDCHHKLHGEFKCQFCPAVKKYAPNLAQHELTHSKLIKREIDSCAGEKIPARRLGCSRCAKTFHFNYTYAAHHLTEHLSLTLVSNLCAICGTSNKFASKWDLISHYKLHHDIEGVDSKSVKRCQVENCSAYFLNLSRLISHLRQRHGANQTQLNEILTQKRKMFRCEDCNKNFATKPYLRAHRVKYHAEVENILHCKFEKCTYTCETVQDLEHHCYYRHCFKNMEFIDCPKCSKSCNGVSSLKMHMLSHQTSSERIKRSKRKASPNSKNISKYRFKCPDCSLLFRELHKLLLHRKGFHYQDDQTELDAISEANPFASDSSKITVEIILFPNRIVPASLDKAKAFKICTKVQIVDDVHVCPVNSCQRPFYSSSDLEAHSRLHGEFKCNDCEVVKEYAPELSEHELTHSKKADENSSWDCPRCKLKFQVKELYLSHHLATHMNLEFVEEDKCGICGLSGSFSRINSSLIKHYKLSHGFSDTSVNCFHTCKFKNCGAYFNTRKKLTAHRRLQHNNELEENETWDHRVKCKDCQKTYKTIDALRLHRRKTHPETFIFRCPVPKCTIACETQVDLESHRQWKHSSSRMDFVECPKCKKSLNGTGSLQRHMKIHDRKELGPSSVARFVCETCGKTLSCRNSLDLHSLSHSGPESWQFICDVCSKKCLTQQKLDEHKRTHSKEKPFVCQVCGQKYAHRHNLRIHVNNKHGDVTEDRPTIVRKCKPESSNVGTNRNRKRKRKRNEDKESGDSTD